VFVIFSQPNQLIKEDTPTRLVLARQNRLRLWGALSLGLALVSLLATLAVGMNPIGGGVSIFYAGLGAVMLLSRGFVIFDATQQLVLFTTRLPLFEYKSARFDFSEIESVYLDYETLVYPGLKNIIHVQDRIWRKWFLFLTLNSRETVTVAQHQRSYPRGTEPVLSKETVVWESLAVKVCAITEKLLIRTAAVPGQAPRTFIEVVDQILQRRLDSVPPNHPLVSQTIRLRSHPTGRLEFVVNGTIYRELNEITDPAVRELIKASVAEWNGGTTQTWAETPPT